MRDEQLDIYRALAVMYVVCFLHVLYCLNDGQEPYKSLSLIAMSAIFFISGAALAVKRKQTECTFATVVWNRTKRVIIPYYLYAIIVLIFGVLLTILYGNIKMFKEESFDIFGYQTIDVLKVLCCAGIPKLPFTDHLWFILPYFVLSSTFGAQQYLIGKTNRYVYILICILVFGLVRVLLYEPHLVTITGYNIFMVAGYLFYKKMRPKQMVFVGLVALIQLLVFIGLGGAVIPLQKHKFPPDFVFVTYNIMTLSILGVLCSCFRMPTTKIFKIWNERGYTIYLYQSFVFMLVYVIREYTYVNLDLWQRLLIDSIFVFILSTLLSYVTMYIERMAFKIHRIK